MRKLIDLSEDAVEALTIQAVKEKTVFKLKAEQILNDYAKPFMALKKPKSAWAKLLFLFFRSSYRCTCYEARGIAENGGAL